MLELARSPHASRVGELEGPEEVVGFLEVGTDSGDLMDQVFDADNVVLAESLGNDGVVVDGDALLVDLCIAALVDQFTDGLQVGVAVGDVGLNELKHLFSGLVDADKDTVVDLEKTEKLQDLTGLGRDVVDTADTDDEHKLRLSRDIEVTVLLGLATEVDLSTLSLLVLSLVLGSTSNKVTTLSTLGL